MPGPEARRDGRRRCLKFWDEVAAQTPRNAKVVEILKAYNVQMEKAGPPYRYPTA